MQTASFTASSESTPSPADPTAGAPLAGRPAWLNRFHSLGPAFSTAWPARALPGPHWVARNEGLARELGLDLDWLASDEALDVFTGNRPWGGNASIATVYSGHQFGMWAGQLGDGRALLLGETRTAAGPMEFQLKGSGPTPYSRMGDGRAVLRSSIREFLASEALHGLGVATTRALCITGSPAPVRREETETAAVVTRVAPSFIRFGHFEHFSHNGLHDELRQLADFVIAHHYPGCADETQPYTALLAAVTARTAALMADWKAIGFCHGVMNTDNMSILGLTLDYGPFQFLDGFDPTHICNHSDHQGRYAYNRQPNVAMWNLYALGQALMPLIGDSDTALAALETYKADFPGLLRRAMGAKLGLPELDADGEIHLLNPLLQLMARERTDYPIFWRRLSEGLPGTPQFEAVRDLFLDRPALDAWAADYTAHVAGRDTAAISAAMLRTNPKYVLRNHLAQTAIEAAENGDFQPTQDLLSVLSSPYDEHPQHDALAGFPPDWASNITISCSS